MLNTLKYHNPVYKNTYNCRSLPVGTKNRVLIVCANFNIDHKPHKTWVGVQQKLCAERGLPVVCLWVSGFSDHQLLQPAPEASLSSI